MLTARPARRYQDHASPDERIDRRNPAQELARRAVDKKRLAAYPWAFGVVCLFVAVMNHVRWTDKVVDIEEARAAEIVALQAKIERLTPRPRLPMCSAYSLHMEPGTVVHCQSARWL